MIINTVNRLIDWLFDPTRHVTVYTVFLSVHNHSLSPPTKQKNPNQSIKIKKKNRSQSTSRLISISGPGFASHLRTPPSEPSKFPLWSTVLHNWRSRSNLFKLLCFLVSLSLQHFVKLWELWPPHSVL